ncbi:MAG: D-2-hydroxyacid dehydrogenase [Campylobacterales bacterium]
MKKPKAVFFDYATLGGTSLEKIKKYADLEVYELTSRGQILARAADAQIVITNKVVLDEEILVALPKLKLICVAATGVNNIDLGACKKLGIAVANVKGYSTQSVAQIVFSSLFYMLSKVHKFDDYVKSGHYAKSPTFTCMEPQFCEIHGKTIGIVGFGEIGRKVAKIARSFGLKVLYFSTSGQNSQKGYKRVSLDELLNKSDIVSVHCSLNEKTKNLIGQKELFGLKKDAILMNFARGGIVVEADVASALNEGKLGGYISDVFESEPISANSALLGVCDKSRLVLTPHIAWASVEARDRLVDGIAKNIRAFFDGKNTNRVV